MLKTAAKQTLSRFGVEDQARHIILARTRQGRRGLRDDRQMSFFMSSVLQAHSNCVDVGAHRGWILADIVRLAPEGKHFAFEPIPDLAADLTRDFPDVDVHGIALSDEAGETTFHIASAREQSGLQQRDWIGANYRPVTVQVRRLDDMIPDGHTVDFLKVDVEGAQVRTLLGAKRVLEESRPALWFEHGDRSAGVYGTTTADLWNLLDDLNYRIWTADGEGPLSLREMENVGTKPMWTFMAHP